ncbi:MAG: sulfotransferase, partial [Eubacteriales bacterium]
MKKAVFHIGYPKTGTTTLQHFLADNIDTLRENGYYYAERTFISHVGNASDIYIAGLPGFDPEALKKIFDEDVKKSEGLTILYSHEVLFNLEHDFYSFLADYFDEIKIIVYLRRQDKWLESYKRWQISAGVPMKESKREVPYRMTDYHKVIKKVAKHLGSSAILIRPFERKQFYKQNINYDFLEVLGIPEEKFETFSHSKKVLNISMNGKALVFKKLLNRYLPLRAYQLKNSKDVFGTWRGTHISKALGEFPLDAEDKA